MTTGAQHAPVGATADALGDHCVIQGNTLFVRGALSNEDGAVCQIRCSASTSPTAANEPSHPPRPADTAAMRAWLCLLLAAACTDAPVEHEEVSDGPLPTGTPVAGARPAIATGVGGQLVVWDTPRHGTVDIHGARLEASGLVLDPDGIAIATADGTQIAPRVAWNGEVYLVVWKDDRLGRAAIFATRVAPDGAVLDPDGIRVAAPGGSTQSPDVASDGADFLVAWEGPSDGHVHGISAAIVGGDGSVGEARRVAAPLAVSYTPAVAFAGDSYLLAWAEIRDEQHDLAARRVSTAGEPGAAFDLSTAPGNQIAPALATDGDGFLATWQDLPDAASAPRTFAARISRANTVLDRDGLVLSAGGRWRDAPDVTWTGAGYMVTWTEAHDATIAVHARTVSTDGALSPASQPFTTPSAGASPIDDDKRLRLAAIDGRTTLTWQAPLDGDFTVLGAQLSDACEPLSPPTAFSTALAP